MSTQKEKFLRTYEEILAPIAKELMTFPDYQVLYGPHVPGVGKEYWDLKGFPKMAFVGQDVGQGRLIKDDFTSLRSYIEYYSEAMNEYDILSWNIHRQTSFAYFVVSILARVFDTSIESIVDESREDVLESFVWANTSSIWNYNAWKKKDKDLTEEKWWQVKTIYKSLDDLDVLVSSTEPDVVVITDWKIEKHKLYLSQQLEMVSTDYHLNVYKHKRFDTLIIHTNHPRSFYSDYGKGVGGNFTEKRVEEIYPIIEEFWKSK